jgi:hypothetical protein
MTNEIDMKRLHQGCGESLQSKIPGILLFRRVPAVDVSQWRHRAADRIRYKQNQQHNESND